MNRINNDLRDWRDADNGAKLPKSEFGVEAAVPT